LVIFVEQSSRLNTVELARYLIGKVAVHETDDGRLSGRIVEMKAYPVGDSARHAFRGETPSKASLFLGRGYAHVYFTCGSSFMLNVTSEAAGVGAGVLLRALEPLEESIGCEASAPGPACSI
jgi:DNA-3-methyladenine glycosylase